MKNAGLPYRNDRAQRLHRLGESPAERDAGEPDPRVQEHACGEHGFDEPLRHERSRAVQAVDDCVEDDGGGEDHAGLKAATGAEVAVKLHVQREQ